MKIKKLETHDRLLEFKKQSDYIGQGCKECMDNRPDAFTMPYYIFAHARTIQNDERIGIYQDQLIRASLRNMIPQYETLADVPTTRMIWTPRLTRPRPQENSMCFKAYPPGDGVKIVWIIPAQELWGSYEKGTMTENSIVKESLYKFKNAFDELSSPESDDLDEKRVAEIYQSISNATKFVKI